MSYQKVTGSLMANSHPGSYCGQDAYNDMLVVDDGIFNSENRRIQDVRPGKHDQQTRLQECNRSHYRRGGGDDMDETVRRLTPTECEILQGYPEGWTLIGEPDGYDTWKDERGEEYPVERYVYVTEDGKKKKVTDSERYKALGNSICLPFWFYLLRRISAQYERPATLGSLFDGIGGFSLAWQRCNGEGTVLWASEIEPFCIAVTKEHFS